MKNAILWNFKFFAGLGILAFIAGILNAFVFNHGLLGLSGTVVGGWIAYDNIQKIRACANES